MLTKIFLGAANAGAEWVLWLLLILSFASIAVIVDRWLFFRRCREDHKQLKADLQRLLGARDMRGAQELVSESPSIEAVIVSAGLGALQWGIKTCGEAMLSAKAEQRTRIDARLGILGTIGANAPFVGLLGTVLGIIKAAHDLALERAGQVDPQAVMAGVFEALVATAVGLFVAIPAVVAFNYFQRKVRITLAEVDSSAHLVLAYLQAERRAPTAAAKSGAPAPVPVPAVATAVPKA